MTCKKCKDFKEHNQHSIIIAVVQDASTADPLLHKQDEDTRALHVGFACLQKNHLSGLRQMLLKVSFYTSQQLMEVKRELQPIIRRNKNKSSVTDAYKAFGPQRNNQTVKLQVGLYIVLILVSGGMVL